MIEPSASFSTAAVDEFSIRFTKQAGAVYPAKTPAEVVSTVNDLIKSRAKGESCCTDDIELGFGSMRSNISDQVRATTGYASLRKDPRKIIGQIDLGITRADYGVAETGTIVDISYSDEHRLLSALTRVHVAVLERSRILTRLSDLSPVMNDLLNLDNPRKPAISFIGGPSRTSDIELKSVLGVHGPHEVHVVLI